MMSPPELPAPKADAAPEGGPRAILHAIQRGLPRRFQSGTQPDQRHGPWFGAAIASLVLLVVFLISSIAENEVQNGWEDSIRPWLVAHQTDWRASNIAILIAVLGWVLVLVAGGLIYAGSRQLLGELSQCRSDKGRIESDVVRTLEGEVNASASEIACREKELRLLEQLKQIDREIYILTMGIPGEALTDDAAVSTDTGSSAADYAVYSLFRRAIEVFGDGHSFRVAVYLPDPEDADYLTIHWAMDVGENSKRFNRWYIGDQDVGQHPDKRRGIPGSVYREGRGRANADVQKDPDFFDPHVPPRPTLSYKSTLHAVVRPPDESTKLGVVAFDSQTYVFTDHDLGLIESVARRLGHLVHIVQADGMAGGSARASVPKGGSA